MWINPATWPRASLWNNYLDLLVCDPEGNARVGLSLALEQLMQAGSTAHLRLWRLQPMELQPGIRLLTPNQRGEACGSLDVLLDRLRPAALVAVGWYTWSEPVVRRAEHRNILMVFLSQGVGCWVLYRLRPLAGLVRSLLWALALLGDIRTLRGLDVLVVAYRGCCWFDSLSFDDAVARRLGCKDYTIANKTVAMCYMPHWTSVESPPHHGLHGPLRMAKGRSSGSGNPGPSSIGEQLFAVSRPLMLISCP
jgi:hypothetical protein